jgi:hypothetical protein
VAITVNTPPNVIHSSVTLGRGEATSLRPLTWKVMDNDNDPVQIISATGSDPSYTVQLVDSETIFLSTTADSPEEGTLTFVVVDSFGAESTSTVRILSTG